MSIQTEINRFKNTKADLKKSIERLGQYVSESDYIDYYPSILNDIPVNNANALTVNGATVSVPKGLYKSAVSKTVTDSNLVASNIKKGVSIFGIEGTYEGEQVENVHIEVINSLGDNVRVFYEDAYATGMYDEIQDGQSCSISVEPDTTIWIQADSWWLDERNIHDIKSNCVEFANYVDGYGDNCSLIALTALASGSFALY